MKKVLALVLVVVMAFGMASVGFAATSTYKAKGLYAYNLSYGYGYGPYWTLGQSYGTINGQRQVIGINEKEGTIGKPRLGEVNNTNNTVTYGSDIVPHDKVKDYINLFVGMFNWGTENGARVFPSYAYVVPGSYKLNAAGTMYIAWDGVTETADISKAMFEPLYGWADAANRIPNARINEYELVTGADIRNSKIAVRTSVSAGSKAIDSVSISNKDGWIEIKYAEELVSTSALDFDFTVYLTIDGKRYNDEGLNFIGTLANPITEVYSGDDYVDLSYGQVAEAMEFVPKIEVDLGNGVSIFTKFFKTKKYYGTSTRDTDEYDDIVFSKYPDVDNVVTLKTVGLNSTGDIVKLSTDYSDYWVYDKDMNYLGQSNTMLPYSTKYYLANKQLNVTDSDLDEIGDAPTTEGVNPETGGDDLPSQNPNGNPSTGR